MVEPRPRYWDIMLAYLHEGYTAWRERRDASAVEVERRLSLSFLEGRDFIEELTRLRLIKETEAVNDIGAYRLLPKGLAFMEGLPSLEYTLQRGYQAIDKTVGPAEAEKEAARFSLKEYLIKKGMDKGTDFILDALPQIWRMLRAQFPWLPDIAI